jgi:hypothetical protein
VISPALNIEGIVMLRIFASRLVVAGSAFFVTSGVCWANTASDTAASWGLLGTWEIVCGAPPSVQNLVLGWVVRGGKLYHERNWGTGNDSPEATGASVMPDGSLVLTVSFDAGKRPRQFAILKRDDDHIQTIWNKNVVGGEYLVRDGKVVKSGQATPLQTRCH